MLISIYNIYFFLNKNTIRNPTGRSVNLLRKILQHSRIDLKEKTTEVTQFTTCIPILSRSDSVYNYTFIPQQRYMDYIGNASVLNIIWISNTRGVDFKWGYPFLKSHLKSTLIHYQRYKSCLLQMCIECKVLVVGYTYFVCPVARHFASGGSPFLLPSALCVQQAITKG